jgi:hypothetical protein
MASDGWINVVYDNGDGKTIVRGRHFYEDDEMIQLKTRAGYVKTIRKEWIL